MYGGDVGQLMTVLRRRFPAAVGYVEAAARTGEEGGLVRSHLGRTCPPPSTTWLEVTGHAGGAGPGGTRSPDGGGQTGMPEPGWASWSSPAEPAPGPPDPHPGGVPRGRRAARDRGRFTRNFVVQASAADWALVLLAAVRRRLAGRGADPADGAHLVFFQHDEVVVHCPRDDAERVAAEVREAADESGRLVFGDTPVQFPLSVAVVDCYADAK
jgi:DNA polymerase-1